MVGQYIAFISFLFLSLLALLYFITRPRPITIPVKNRHVFITGGSSGIGLSLARNFALEGANVSILDIRNLEEAKEAIKLSTGVDVNIFKADVRDFDAVKKAIEDAGPIDILVCNQGIIVAQEMEFLPLDTIKSTIDINLVGNFHLIKAALPLMKKDRHSCGPASIAIMSSQAGLLGVYGYTAYSASKFALRGLAEALQQEVIADDIHVSLIVPSDTDTPGLQEDNRRRPKLTSRMGALTRLMKADEVAKISINGIKKGSFIIPCNFQGRLVSIATAGMSPQRSYLMASVEAFAAGAARLIALFFLWGLYESIEKWHSKRKGRK